MRERATVSQKERVTGERAPPRKYYDTEEEERNHEKQREEHQEDANKKEENRGLPKLSQRQNRGEKKRPERR